ncbi:hypothetical protein BpHYR1_012221 [Brachionus plicatilis]|uniref:Uncharacterized protein n=1 Tax=Brachionus plicatilis TaxID=10195 RepID=A0A3M7P1R6_BRAPC|nr:hypothetical protein BpHYR1_012221 [Brachionus plicatilis]
MISGTNFESVTKGLVFEVLIGAVYSDHFVQVTWRWGYYVYIRFGYCNLIKHSSAFNYLYFESNWMKCQLETRGDLLENMLSHGIIYLNKQLRDKKDNVNFRRSCKL